MDVNENTLYPLLRRLEKDELLTTYLKESDEGRSRKYYAITLKGKDYLQKRIQDWYEFTEVVNHILKGGNKDE